MVSTNEIDIKKRISKKLYSEASLNCLQLNVTLEERKNRLDKLDSLIFKLYDEKVEGVISEAIFRKLAIKYESEYNECKQEVQNLEKEIRTASLNESSIDKWINLIKESNGLEPLETKMLLSLIERIIIGNAPKNNEKSNKDVTIIYNHVGDLSWLFSNDKKGYDYINT